MEITDHMVMIARTRNGHMVVYSSALNGERETWRSYETSETVAEIREYVAQTYPRLNPLFVVVED